jgi:protein-L-isoaspartate(D-aspartate) O-methyltransferase
LEGAEVTEADLAAMRGELVDRLLDSGRVRPGEVAAAFRGVPRHLFLPEVDPAQAYADEAIPVKWDADGRAISSSSQPAIMAVMLEQLRLRPGQRVLEIGTGTGYNAALLAHLVGDTGTVVTVDIDAELASAARQRLTAAGYPSVVVAAGDGAAGWPGGAPYDRVVVTASARDLAPAWTSQLGDGGRLVLPLSLRGVMQSVAFVRAGDHLASTSVVPCGFMPLQGELAGRDPVRPFGDVPGVFLRLEDDRDVDLAALHATLSTPGQAVATGVTITGSYLFSGLGLWLVLHDPDVGELTEVGPAVGHGPIPAVNIGGPGWASTTVLAGAAGLAAIARPAGAERADAFEAWVRGYGADGDQLAERLAAGIRGWESAGRPAAWTLRVRAYPAGAAAREGAGFTIARPHTRFLLDW